MNNWHITFCQQIGSNKKHNQDALFNGEQVFQYKLKKAETIFLAKDPIILGIADGISSSPQSQLASRFVMEQLAPCQSLNTQWLRKVQKQLSQALADRYLGASTTFVGAEISTSGKGKILNVGDSRAYKITTTGEWLQLSFDHALLAEMQAQQLAQSEIEYASIYHILSDYLVADDTDSDFKIYFAEFQLQQGESLLLCSDGLTNYISEQQRKLIWQKYPTTQQRLTVCRKLLKNHRLYDDFSVVVCERKMIMV